MPKPLEYSEQVATEICAELIGGRSLRSICADETMPASSTIFKWLSRVPQFAEQYARAREAQADAMLEELLEIADNGTGDSWTDEDGVEHVNNDVIARSRLRVDARKWAMSKMAPKKYGEKLDVNQSGKLEHVHEIRRTIVRPDDPNR